MKKIANILSFVLVLFLVNTAAAADKNITSLGEDLSYTEINQKLAMMEKSIRSGKATSEEMSDIVKYIGEKRIQLADSKKRIENTLKFIEKRIEALGEVPENGKEVALIAQKRKEFTAELATEKARVAEVDILLTRIDELDMTVFNQRHKELLGNILIRVTPLVMPSEFIQATSQFAILFYDVIKSPLDWYRNLSPADSDIVKAKLIPVLLIILFMSWVGYWLRMLLIRKFGYRKDIEYPRYGRKIFAAFIVAVAYGVIPSFIIGTLLAWLQASSILTTGFLGVVLRSFLYYALFVIMGRAISRVTFAPYNEKWRLVNVDSAKAKRLTSALYFSVTTVGIMAFLIHIVTVGNYPIELLTFLIAISSAVKAFCIILITKRVFWEDENFPEEEMDGGEIEDESCEEDNSFAFRMTFFISLFALSAFLLSIFGYPYLSAYILNHFIFSVLIIAALAGVRKSLYEVLHRLLLLRFWVKTFRMRRRIINKIDFWSNLILDPLFILMGLFILLALWGIPTDTLKNLVYSVFMGFTVGGVRVSLISIVLGIVSFFVVLALVKAMRRRLQDNVLARMDIDEGVKHSLSAGFGFVGYIVAVLLAFAIMGGNLTNFALVAGALSVGIGLGLQNIVNNFVSGIILLFERPIKVGDWVVINGEEGKVKQINIRSTEIETFKRASVIIPNANLLSGTVTNLTHSNNWARYGVSVGVAYGSDTEKVKNVLLECAQNHKKVLKKPEPYVVFKDFGSSSLDFELRVYVSDIWSGWLVPSDLRFAINQRFIEEGIEIPFNQMVVHQGSEVSKQTETQFYAGRKKGKKDAAE